MDSEGVDAEEDSAVGCWDKPEAFDRLGSRKGSDVARLLDSVDAVCCCDLRDGTGGGSGRVFRSGDNDSEALICRRRVEA
jgi:hypothetical protein